MKWYRVDNFFEVWRPLYLITKFFGLSTITINFQDQSAERTATDQLLLIAGTFICILVLYTSYGTYQNRILQMSESYIMSVGLFATFVLFLLTMMLTLVMNYRNAFRIFKLGTILRSVDQQLFVQFGHRWDYQKDHFTVVVSIVAGFVEWLVFFSIIVNLLPTMQEEDDLHYVVSSMLSFVWLMLCYKTSGLYVLAALTAIRNRFSALNVHIRTNFKTTVHAHPKNNLRNTDQPDLSSKLIKKCAILHDQLSDTVELFNHCFSTQAMFSLASAFGFTVFSLFGLIHSYSGQVDEKILRLGWSNMIYDGFYMSFIIQLVVFSSLVNNECKRTSTVIHKVICYGSHDRRSLKELRRFSQQMWHHAPKISCGLFDIDWVLFYTMIGSLTTYLIILMQFDLVNLNVTASNN